MSEPSVAEMVRMELARGGQSYAVHRQRWIDTGDLDELRRMTECAIPGQEIIEHRGEPCRVCGGTDSEWLGYPNSEWHNDGSGWLCPLCKSDRKKEPLGGGG